MRHELKMNETFNERYTDIVGIKFDEVFYMSKANEVFS